MRYFYLFPNIALVLNIDIARDIAAVNIFRESFLFKIDSTSILTRVPLGGGIFCPLSNIRYNLTNT